MHRNGLYLPQPEFPTPQNHVKTLRRGRVTKSMSSSVPELSESDVEEGISEADRDARLA